jgi:penicillin-binding protein 1A
VTADSMLKGFFRKKLISWRSILIVILVLMVSVFGYVFYLVQDLAALQNLEKAKPALASKVYSARGELIHQFFTHNRTFVNYKDLPPHLVDALVASEDASFWEHWGVSVRGAFRAIYIAVVNLGISQGASTITMQVARNLYDEIGFRKSLSRKIREMITAIEIERHYSKEEIIEMYLNVSFFGHNYYGIQSACKNYFNKDVGELTIEESAVLIGILPSPNRYSPFNNLERSLFKRNLVLNRMHDVGALEKATLDSLVNLSIKVEAVKEESKAPYFTEYIRKKLNSLQDSLNVNLYQDGLKIYTTLDTRIQNAMDSSIVRQLPAIQARARSQGRYERLREELDNDSLFLAKTTVQIGFMAISPNTGQILAMVGGIDFSKYKFNHATQALRQPGSAFKPFLYTTAIENGILPTYTLPNQPVVLINPDGTRWTPENYDRSVGGLTSIRNGLRRSLNLIAIRLIEQIGPSNVVYTARRFGLTTRLRAVPALALGTSEVYLPEMLGAYSVFANHGIKVTPYGITRVEDQFGSVIYEEKPQKEEVLSESTTYLMNNLLQNVVNAGTGVYLRTKHNIPYSIQIGGKTGTTADFTDAWFMGFTKDVVAGVWVGMEQPEYKLGSGMSGAIAALPFFGDFIKTVYDSSYYKPSKFEKPENSIVTHLICRESNKLALTACPDKYEEIFDIRFQPTEKCEIHTRKKPNRNRPGPGF